MSTASAPIITRFAPSPTGHLHIGGARTALFCWAYARSIPGAGGKFLIRIEDTDQARSSEASAQGILKDLAWLGILWDEGPSLGTLGGDPRNVAPFEQSKRLVIYNGVIDDMMTKGLAYADFSSAEKLAEARKAAEAAKQTFRYHPPASEILPLDEQRRRIASGEKHVVRFRASEEPVKVTDEVLGEVAFGPGEVDDFVLRKADGFPTYHFGVVVDDELMGVTHVLRGQEHLMNTPRHVALQKALNYRTPVYAHMPLIFNDQGAKMSKRERDQAARKTVADVLGAVAVDPCAPCDAWTIIQNWLRIANYGDQTKTVMESALRASLGPPFSVAAADLIQHGPDHVLAARPDLADSTRTTYKSYLNKAREVLIETRDQVIAKWLNDKKSQLEAERLERLAECLAIQLPEVSVSDFRKAGYLPEVICNFIALLGWNPGDNVERFDMDFLAKHFDLARIGKTNARFDRKKLAAFNADTIGAMPDDALFDRWLEWCDAHAPAEAAALRAIPRDRQVLLAKAIKPRARTLREALKPAAFALVTDDALAFDPASMDKAIKASAGAGRALLQAIREPLAALADFSPTSINAAIEAFATSKGIKVGDAAQPLRVAVTGSTVSPGLGETLAVLGKASVLKRIDRCLAASA